MGMCKHISRCVPLFVPVPMRSPPCTTPPGRATIVLYPQTHAQPAIDCMRQVPGVPLSPAVLHCAAPSALAAMPCNRGV
jgi:hypothetical protein